MWKTTPPTRWRSLHFSPVFGAERRDYATSAVQRR